MKALLLLIVGLFLIGCASAPQVSVADQKKKVTREVAGVRTARTGFAEVGGLLPAPSGIIQMGRVTVDFSKCGHSVDTHTTYDDDNNIKKEKRYMHAFRCKLSLRGKKVFSVVHYRGGDIKSGHHYQANLEGQELYVEFTAKSESLDDVKKDLSKTLRVMNHKFTNIEGLTYVSDDPIPFVIW